MLFTNENERGQRRSTLPAHLGLLHGDLQFRTCAVPNSVLFLGRPGVGKTTVVREMARVLADDLHKRVVIVDTSNEIGGDGDVRPVALSNDFVSSVCGCFSSVPYQE